MRRSDIRSQTASVRLAQDQNTETLRWYVLRSRLSLVWSRLGSRPALVFVLLSFAFGSAISVVVPALRGPDEIAHFLRIYSYARGGLLPRCPTGNPLVPSPVLDHQVEEPATVNVLAVDEMLLSSSDRVL